MNDHAGNDPTERSLDRATRLTPQADRERYVEEWRADVEAARNADLSPQSVARGAVSLALRLRIRQLGRLLLGREGFFKSALLWLLILVVVGITPLFGGFFVLLTPLLLLAIVGVFLVSGLPTVMSHRVQVASGVVALGSAAYLWWASGEMIDSADALRPASDWVRFTGPATILLLLCVAVFLVVSIRSVLRRA